MRISSNMALDNFIFQQQKLLSSMLNEQMQLSTGQAVRVFPDGSFDAFVRLAPGENTLRSVARGEQCGQQVVERRVAFDAREPASPEEAAAIEAEAERIRQALSLRAVEMELGAEARRRAATPEQGRELEVTADPSAE